MPAGQLLDHVGVVVRDLDVARKAYERLGFRLTPRSRHWGPVGPDAVTARWGTANHCAVLSKGYVEITGIVDAALHSNRLEDLLARHQGCHIMAFASSDLVATHTRLLARGFSPGAETALSRPTEDGVDRLAFRLVRMTPEDVPEGRVVFLQHETPELIWHPGNVVHPNGATALSDLFICVHDVAETAARYANLLDATMSTAGDGSATVALLGQRVEIMNPSYAAKRLPGLGAGPVPFAAGFAVEVDDLGVTAEHLRRSGVDSAIRADEIVVAAAEAGGAVCVFRSGATSF